MYHLNFVQKDSWKKLMQRQVQRRTSPLAEPSFV